MLAKHMDAIKQALLDSVSEPDKAPQALTETTRFCDVAGIDSMSLVNFQMELERHLGSKVTQLTPMPEMTLSEYADLLEDA